MKFKNYQEIKSYIKPSKPGESTYLETCLPSSGWVKIRFSDHTANPVRETNQGSNDFYFGMGITINVIKDFFTKLLNAEKKLMILENEQSSSDEPFDISEIKELSLKTLDF